MNKPVSPASFVMAASRPARFTTAEFLRMCEVGAFDDIKVELIDGELERMTPPMGAHSYWQTQAIGLLWDALGSATRGLVVGEIGIDLGNDTVVACDAAILTAPVTDHRWVSPGEIQLVIEVAQTTLPRDLGYKRNRYAAEGIPCYWVIDCEGRAIHVYSGVIDDVYADIRIVRFGEPLAVPGTDQTIVIA